MPTDAETPKIIEVADGIGVRQEVDNITWIDMGDHGIVVDTLEQPDTEADVLAAVRATLGDKPVRTVLNTHTHYDHVVLNPVFQREFGAEIVNQRTAPAGEDGRWFEGTKRRLHWQPMPGCHTEEDCIAWLPDDRVLLVGDIFGWGLIPLTRGLNEETAGMLRRTYRHMIDLDPAVMIPGHGPLGDKSTLERWLEYFDWLIDRCRQLAEAGRSDEEITAELAPPQDMRHWWRFCEWKHGDSVNKVLRSVRRGKL